MALPKRDTLADTDTSTAFTEAFRKAGQQYYYRQRKKAAALPPLSHVELAERNLEVRERTRAQRHYGSVIRKLHKTGLRDPDDENAKPAKLSLPQVETLERWCSDYVAGHGSVRSCLNDEPRGGGSRDIQGSGDADAWQAYLAAAVSLEAGGEVVAKLTYLVALLNRSLTAAVAEAYGPRALTAVEALDMVRAGADYLGRHYERLRVRGR